MLKNYIYKRANPISLVWEVHEVPGIYLYMNVYFIAGFISWYSFYVYHISVNSAILTMQWPSSKHAGKPENLTENNNSGEHWTSFSRGDACQLKTMAE